MYFKSFWKKECLITNIVVFFLIPKINAAESELEFEV